MLNQTSLDLQEPPGVRSEISLLLPNETQPSSTGTTETTEDDKQAKSLLEKTQLDVNTCRMLAFY